MTSFTLRSPYQPYPELKVIQCEFIPFPHGFSTRLGGYSEESHLSSLNVGYGIGDNDETVNQNRSKLLSALVQKEASYRDIVWANQIHSPKVLYVTSDDCGRDDIYADGFVTDIPGVPLMIKTADCCPILLCDPIANVIGAVHAGWRGTVSHIAANAVDAMCNLGAKKENIICAIGPCIHECCFEVGDDFVSEVKARLPESIFESCVKPYPGGKFHANLTCMNEQILQSAEILPKNIHILPSCSCCQPDLFFSHRATKGKRGLMGSVIILPEKTK